MAIPMALSAENCGWAKTAPQLWVRTARSWELEATPPEHSTGRPGYRCWASRVTRSTTFITVSRAKRAMLAGFSPSDSSFFT